MSLHDYQDKPAADAAGLPEEEDFIQLPGTEGHPGYKNYAYHFIAFLKGCVFSVLGSLLFAGVIRGVVG